MEKHSIGKTIAYLRKEKDWTQVEFAEKLNASDKVISKWESDKALPEISQLLSIANLFDVSLDYLMTGKTPEKEIITMSKAELCAKNDDVNLAKEVKDLPKDENGKNIVDYIVKYQSFNVFKKLCEIDSRFITRFKILDAITLAILSNSLSVLKGKIFKDEDKGYSFTFEDENEIKSLRPEEEKNLFRDHLERYLCMLPRNFFKMIVTDKRINEETMNILLSSQRLNKSVWYYAFPYLIEEAYKNNKKDLLEKLLDISNKNNSVIYQLEVRLDNYDRRYNYQYNYFTVKSIYSRDCYGIVRVLESTIKLALKKGNFDLVKKLNKINSDANEFIIQKLHVCNSGSSICYVASEDEIRVAKLKLNKAVSEYELQVQSAIHSGIISIKELVDIKDFSTIKTALYAYPIHPFEIFYKSYQEKNWKRLFEIAIDSNMTDLADALISQNNKKIEENILTTWQREGVFSSLKSLYINSSELYVNKRDQYRYGYTCNRPGNNLIDVINYLNNVRQRIIDELSNNFNKDKIVSEYPKEYFYSELKKGNREMVIIKLCVRMEAVLKCDYHYEGDFSEMLDCYCSRFNTLDDEGNDYDPHTPELLNKLRKERNGIVHSEKSLPQLSDNEIESCIEYICSL